MSHPAEHSVPSPEPAADVDVERAAERLLEDEALRGDLTDDQFGPLLDAVISLAVARGGLFSSTDGLYIALRALLLAATEAVASGNSVALVRTAAPFLGGHELTALGDRAGSLPVAPEARAASIARRLRAAGESCQAGDNITGTPLTSDH